MINLLRKIRKLKYSELKKIAFRLDLIQRKKQSKIDINDINDALSCCDFHFSGGMYESFGLEICPCNCYCQSCEVIPESAIPVRMQELARDMNEENVMNKFIEQYCTKDKDGSIKLTTSR